MELEEIPDPRKTFCDTNSENWSTARHSKRNFNTVQAQSSTCHLIRVVLDFLYALQCDGTATNPGSTFE